MEAVELNQPTPGFDPKIHATDKDGNPSLTKNGNFRKKKGAGQRANPTKSAYKAMGQMLANQTVFISAAIGGEDFLPRKQDGIDEMRNLAESYQLFLESKEITDLPAGVALAIGLSSYYLPRFVMPERRKSISSKISGFFGNLRGRVRRKKKAPVVAIDNENLKENPEHE